MTPPERSERMVLPGAGPTDDDLRQDVELTREELAETVEALAHKADVGARVRAMALRPTVAGGAAGTVLVVLVLVVLWWRRR